MVAAIGRIGATVALLLLASVLRADLDLTPQQSQYEVEGLRFPQLAFADGGRRVTYTPPQGWTYSGGGNHFSLRPPVARGSDAEAVIETNRLPAPQTFDESTIKQLRENAIASLPRGSTHVAIVSEQKNAVLIEKKETFLIVINYDCLSGPYARSIMFLNRQTDQIRFQLTAPRWNFAKLQKEFFASHFSWQNL